MPLSKQRHATLYCALASAMRASSLESSADRKSGSNAQGSKIRIEDRKVAADPPDRTKTGSESSSESGRSESAARWWPPERLSA
eukprot:15241622-Alexandrium_andersonii.AAC.1